MQKTITLSGRVFWMVAFVLLTNALLAQGHRVSGTVADADHPLPGATVVEKGTNNGTTTSLNGNYTLPAHASAPTLVISYTGYQTTEEVVDAWSARGHSVSPKVVPQKGLEPPTPTLRMSCSTS